jgi:hypothetical protein
MGMLGSADFGCLAYSMLLLLLLLLLLILSKKSRDTGAFSLRMSMMVPSVYAVEDQECPLPTTRSGRRVAFRTTFCKSCSSFGTTNKVFGDVFHVAVHGVKDFTSPSSASVQELLDDVLPSVCHSPPIMTVTKNQTKKDMPAVCLEGLQQQHITQNGMAENSPPISAMSMDTSVLLSSSGIFYVFLVVVIRLYISNKGLWVVRAFA